jgi:hypothetical protein
MKAIKFRKKLTFNKQTIAHLSKFEINDVRGGGPTEPGPTMEPLSVCTGCFPTYTCFESIPPNGHC